MSQTQVSVEWVFDEIKSYFKFVSLKSQVRIDRSSHRSGSVRKSVLRNFAKFTGKHLCQSLFFNKVAGLRPETLLKKRLWHMRFPVNFPKFLRTPFLHNTSGRLLLDRIKCSWQNLLCMCITSKCRNMFI